MRPMLMAGILAVVVFYYEEGFKEDQDFSSYGFFRHFSHSRSNMPVVLIFSYAQRINWLSSISSWPCAAKIFHRQAVRIPIQLGLVASIAILYGVHFWFDPHRQWPHMFPKCTSLV